MNRRGGIERCGLETGGLLGEGGLGWWGVLGVGVGEVRGEGWGLDLVVHGLGW